MNLKKGAKKRPCFRDGFSGGLASDAFRNSQISRSVVRLASPQLRGKGTAFYHKLSPLSRGYFKKTKVFEVFCLFPPPARGECCLARRKAEARNVEARIGKAHGNGSHGRRGCLQPGGSHRGYSRDNPWPRRRARPLGSQNSGQCYVQDRRPQASFLVFSS